jgi:peptide chain release factor 2
VEVLIGYETKVKIEDLRKKFKDSMEVFRPDEKEKDLSELERVMSEPDFWSDPKKAQEITKKAQKIRKMLEEAKEIEELFEDLDVAVELSDEDSGMADHVYEILQEVEAKVREFELQMLLSGRYDSSSAYLSVHPGAGGTESHDWAQMLLRMYMRWAERHGFDVEVVDFQPGEEAGVKSATILIKGEYAYGYLKYERGVHRLVRISPFDASHRRHTSFASVNVIPEIEDDVDIEIKPEEIRIDTFRASGHGGQYVNKTESAVRITHIPTGIVVSIQTERSQHKNKEIAMKILKARLLQLEMEKRRREIEDIQGELKDIAWGSQIRSYVFHPYKMVKDHRTGVETGDVDAVMDGDIDMFIEAELVYFAGKEDEE